MQGFIDDKEQYSRRNSLRLNGIPNKYGENTDDEIEKLHTDIIDLDTDRAHRSGSSYYDNNGSQQPILVKFTLVRRFINYVYVDANCNLMAFTSNGRFMKFDSELEFDCILPYLLVIRLLKARLHMI